MNVELLTIYTLASDGQSFSQFLVDGSPVKLLEYDYVSERMGSTSLTATLKHNRCLDSYWTGREFVVLDEASLQGGTPIGSLEVFFLSHVPSSGKDNTDERYSHTLEFKSRRDILLSGVYFRDSVAAGSASAGKFSSDSYQVKFIGTLDEFVSRFNDVLTSLGLQGRFSVSVEQAFQGTTESVEIAFDKQTLAQVLRTAYDTWKVPYYFLGDTAVFGDGGATPLPVQYGYDDELLSVQKNNQNAKIVTRITGVGSKENVPYYYPNPTPKGTLGVGGTAQGVEIVDMLKFCQYVGLSDVLTFMGEDAEFVAVRVASQGKNDVDTTLPADAQIENIDLTSGSQSVFLGWLCTDLSGGYNGPIEMGLDANVGSAAGIDPDADLYHMSWYDDSIPQGYIDAVRKRSYVCEKGWDIAIDRVVAYVGGVNATTRTEIPVPFATVTRDNGITEDDAGLFSPERVCGVTVQAADILSRLPAGSDLSQVTVYVVAHLYSTALWYSSRQDNIGYDRAEFLAQLVEVSLEQYSPRGWYISGAPLNKTLREIGLTTSIAPLVGDTITQTVLSKIPATGVLMPAIYRSSGGAERFYNAQNNTYVNPETQQYWAFEHEYDALEPHEHVEDFSDIKPTIKNLKDGQGTPLNTLTDVYFDDGYNIEDMLPDGETLKYSHFFVKLKALGFNLFDCAIENGEMEVVMSDGPCAGCHFKILVTSDGKNPVQKNANGTLKKENGYGVIDENNIQASQQDTTSTAVWIALSLDDSTFGGTEVENGVMPSYNKNTGAGQRPLANNSYTLGNITLPQAFITAAEAELTNALIKFMAENNADKFQYPVAFSRVYLAENPSVRAGLSVRSSLLLTYAGVTLQAPLYVSQMTVSVKEGEALPDIRVETSDIIESRTAGLDEKIAAAVDARVVVGEGGGGPSLDVTDARYLRKDIDDTVEGTTKFRKGIKIGDYIPGAGGIGGTIYTGSNGESIAEFDFLRVRRKAVFTQVEIDTLRKVAGTILLSLADMTVSAVEKVSGGWKCYFKNGTDDGSAKENGFAVGDQAISQTFGGDNTHYYWRLVTAVGPDWVILSDVSGQYDTNSDAPEVGDTIVQLGSQTDASRQSAQILSCYGENSPSYVVYAGINSFSLAGKDIFGVVYRETSAGSGVYQPFFFDYGSMLIGSRNKSQDYVEYDNASGTMTIKANVVFKAGQTIPGMSELEEEFDTLEENITEELLEFSEALGGLSDDYSSLLYLKTALPQSNTIIAGGLILSKVIALRDANNQIKSGINGDPSLSSIAAWYGGSMTDRTTLDPDDPDYITKLANAAKSLFRFDGSGYLASDKIHWASDGSGAVPGLTWNSDGTTVTLGVGQGSSLIIDGNVKLGNVSGDTVTELLEAVQQVSSWFEEVNYGTPQNPIWALRLKKKVVGNNQYDTAFVTYGDQVVDGATPGEGSGGVSYLRELEDVYHDTTNVKRYTSGNVQTTDLLAYDATKGWYALQLGNNLSIQNGVLSSTGGGGGGGISSVALVEGASNGTLKLNVDGVTGADVEVHGLGSYAFKSNLVASDIPNLSATYQPRNEELDAIAQLTSGAGLLRRAANGTWSLDGATYISTSTVKTLILKVGGTSKGSFNATQDVTIDITGSDIAGAIGSTTYHPYGGAANKDLLAQNLTASKAMTVGNGSSVDSERRIYFGGLGNYMELKNFGTPQSPILGFHFNAPVVSEGDQVVDGTDTIEPGGGGGGGGTPHVLLSQQEWAALQNPDPGTIYLIYES